MRWINSVITLLCVIIKTASYAQNSTSIYLEHFKDENIAFQEYSTTYEYFMNPATGSLQVKESDQISILALKPTSSFIWPIFYNDQIEIRDFDARTSLGKKLKYQRICGHQEQSGIFYSDAKFCTYSVQLGNTETSISIKSEQTILDPRYFTKVPFQSFLSGKNRKIKVVWPEWVEIELVEFNFEGWVIQKNEGVANGKKFVEYQLEWLNKIPDEESKPHFTQYVPHIVPLTKSYRTPEATVLNVLSSTEDLYQWYKQLISGVKNHPETLEELVGNLTENLSEEEKIRSIYYWVQDNIQYIAFENGIMGFQPDNAQDVYFKRYGDCKGMANLLKEMLIIAGFDARLTWLGTNSLPYTYNLPSLSVDNHMICTIKETDKYRILDATVKFNELGYDPHHIQGKQIMIEDGESFIIHTIPFSTFDENYESSTISLRMEDDVLIGDGQLLFQGDAKQFLLYALNNIDKVNQNKFLRYVISEDADPDDFEVRLLSANRDSLVELAVEHKLRNRVNHFGDELYIDLEFRREFAHLKMNKDRKAPFDFGRRRFVSSHMTFKLPEGYKLKYLPKELVVEGETFEFKLNYELIDDSIVYKKQLKIDSVFLSKQSFPIWNSAIDQLTKFYKDPIILEKNAQ
jgi:hypothetical protein